MLQSYVISNMKSSNVAEKFILAAVEQPGFLSKDQVNS